jgi:hypothetical protein
VAIRKSIIASFLLLLFTAAQISVVHEFSHEEDSTECAICIVAQNFQTQSFDVSASVEFDSIVFVSTKEKIVVDLAFAKAESQSIIHTTRPPPFSMDII